MSADRYARQSFLGEHSEAQIAQTTVAVVGLGGGGSHIVQQLAHLGFQNYILFDDDVVEETNLNRLVGATTLDVEEKTPKLEVAKRTILGLQKAARITPSATRWQDSAALLRRSHIVFGAVDSYRGRAELEQFCRRYFINYIDVGMDVVLGGDGRYVIGGQVILSMPEHACMWCMGYLSPEKLSEEGGRYGDAGGKPQVVWSNGALASTAVGIAVALVTDWSLHRGPIYLEYDGNRGTLKPRSSIVSALPAVCTHYPSDDVGDPPFRPA